MNTGCFPNSGVTSASPNPTVRSPAVAGRAVPRAQNRERAKRFIICLKN
jgi:hypothetical protein